MKTQHHSNQSGTALLGPGFKEATHDRLAAKGETMVIQSETTEEQSRRFLHGVTKADVEAVQSQIHALIERVRVRRKARGTATSIENTLWEQLTPFVTDGKMFRSQVMIGAYRWLTSGGVRANNGFRERLLTEACAALEILHAAFLIHDDIIDRDYLRRGKPNPLAAAAGFAHNKGLPAEDATKFADDTNILHGDTLLNIAWGAVARLAVRSSDARYLTLFETAVDETIGGELDDVCAGLFSEGLSIEQSQRIALMKTARYSFTLPFQFAAVLAACGDEELELAANIGDHLGVGYQLGDDYLGVFGDSAVTGKSSTSDIEEGKQTGLIASAQMTPEWEGLRSWLGKKDIAEADLAEIRRLLLTSGSVDKLLSELDAQLAAAAEYAQTLGARREAKSDVFITGILSALKRRQA